MINDGAGVGNAGPTRAWRAPIVLEGEKESQLGWGGIQGASAAQEGFLPLLDVFLDASFTVGPRQMAMPFLPVGSGGQGDRWPSR